MAFSSLPKSESPNQKKVASTDYQLNQEKAKAENQEPLQIESSKSPSDVASPALPKGKKSQPLQVTGKELEEQEPQLSLSSAGTEYQRSLAELNCLPAGSALLTSSGELKKYQIEAIIHACSGSINIGKGPEFEPSLERIVKSVQNSVILAEKKNYKSLAFPLLGGGIFLDRIADLNSENKKQKQLSLAKSIIEASIKQRKSLKKIVFVDFGNEVFQEAWEQVKKDYSTEEIQGINSVGDPQRKKGITYYSLHQCQVIVNPSNLEGEFANSGGLSGFIAGKVGQDKKLIQKEINNCIQQFNQRIIRS